MTSSPEHVSSIEPVPRVRLIVGAIVVCVAVAGAFVAGHITAPMTDARMDSIRRVHLGASLESADGLRRAEVMRKMNDLAEANAARSAPIRAVLEGGTP
jgi:hypothetical protein